MRLRGYSSLFLIPYAPLGIVILILRLVIFAHAYIASVVMVSCGTVKRFSLRVMCLVLGWVISVNDLKCDSDENLLIASNHISLFDHLIMHIIRECVTPHGHVFHWYASYQKQNSSAITKLVERNRKDVNSWHVHLLPETLPSKQQGVVSTFDSEMFESIDSVQPVALKASRIFPIRLVEYPVNWVSELFWQLFTPFTSYSVEFLEPMTRLPDEASSAFAERVRKAIVDRLNTANRSISPVEDDTAVVRKSLGQNRYSRSGSERSSSVASTVSSVYPATSCDTTTRSSVVSNELFDFDQTGDCTVAATASAVRFRGSKRKALQAELNANGSSSSPTRKAHGPTAAFDHLIPTVMEILNHVSEAQIRDALVEANGDMNAAIDALVSTSEASDEEDSSTLIHSSQYTQSNQDTSLVPPSRLKTAAETFHTNSNARQASLSERRKALLAHARQRFVATSPPGQTD